MLLLASTSDLLRVFTTAAIATDVHASWVDLSGTTVTPGRTNTAISTATTTTVVASPGSSTYRTVKTLLIRNRGASAQGVTVTHTDGTTSVELIKTTLAAEECLHYHEAAGFWVTDSLGRARNAESQGSMSVATDADSIVVLASDQTNNNGTANTIADVTGLSFSVTEAHLYWFVFHIVYTAAATTTGSRWSISGPGSPTYLNYASWYSLTSTTRTENNHLQAYDVPAASNATSATTGNNYARIEGVIQPSSNGTLTARFASEVASSAIVAKAGSFVRYRQIN